jgi:general secretion pathway protein J
MKIGIRHKGFTLVELLVALAILSVLFTTVLGVLGSVRKSERNAASVNSIYQMGRISMQRIMDDLSMAFIAAPQMMGKMSDGTERKSGLIGKGGGDFDSVDFTSLSHVKVIFNAKESEEAEVGYYVDNDPSREGVKALYRRESVYIDNDIEKGGTSSMIATGIKRFKLSYYDGEKFEWMDEWNTESEYHKDKLPRAVKILLVFDHPYLKDREIAFTSIAFIGMWKEPIKF